MADERRFTDEEVALIMSRAAHDGLADSTDGEGNDTSSNALPAALTRGLSLHDLQTIASEAGIDPTAVTRAAEAVARGDLVPTSVRHATGAPIALAKTVQFGREIDARTWARMVVLLQDVFAARGRLREEGELREWSNGNLRAVLEPTPTGHQLRISTRKGNAAALRAVGNLGMATSVVVGAVFATVALAKGTPMPADTPWLAMFAPGLLGLGARLQDVFTRRAWGRERAEQMERLPAALRELLPPTN
jgi:hypothetical protein